ncbi:hypothetical protein [Snodgrassella sp. CFCC 13594]|uniref:hypothetical protein n=1 Tax=Snodgrassella sp. CFCC 13594 TaxID=1775559 RepID=UPI00083384D9|nr:hypothetical protein [Snodgrassella sp. CFCC 13594]
MSISKSIRRLHALWLGCWVCLCVAACQTFSGNPIAIPQPLPNYDTVTWLHVTKLPEGQQSLVAAQTDATGAWRWVQTDAFGAPLARQMVDRQGWKNDGFLPPNAPASRLFAALAVLVGAQQHVDWPLIYPQQQQTRESGWTVYRYRQQLLWRIRPQGDNQWDVVLADGTTWLVEVVNE